jgi:hypothetical protein
MIVKGGFGEEGGPVRRTGFLKAYSEWSDFIQSMLYTCMEISQWNLFVQLIYANKNSKKGTIY